MFLIAGLGNPDKKYEKTRHNIGFDTVDALAEKYNISITEKKHKALCGSGVIEGVKVILAKPQTYMNLSGESIAEIVNFYKLDPENDIIVISDDINLATGRIRIRAQGSAGGHNGLKSINACLGTTNYARLRFGIGNEFKKGQQVDYVLGGWKEEEIKHMYALLERSKEIISSFVLLGLSKTMTSFNGKKIIESE